MIETRRTRLFTVCISKSTQSTHPSAHWLWAKAALICLYLQKAARLKISSTTFIPAADHGKGVSHHHRLFRI